MEIRKACNSNNEVKTRMTCLSYNLLINQLVHIKDHLVLSIHKILKAMLTKFYLPKLLSE